MFIKHGLPEAPLFYQNHKGGLELLEQQMGIKEDSEGVLPTTGEGKKRKY